MNVSRRVISSARDCAASPKIAPAVSSATVTATPIHAVMRIFDGLPESMKSGGGGSSCLATRAGGGGSSFRKSGVIVFFSSGGGAFSTTGGGGGVSTGGGGGGGGSTTGGGGATSAITGLTSSPGADWLASLNFFAVIDRMRFCTSARSCAFGCAFKYALYASTALRPSPAFSHDSPML